ncbi:hypothetical protein ACIPY6_43975 [Streptomyces sp. NPDC090054]|uniref:hypothetical protein n=1 Tax=Streptomyces sp. NPDC090054 TaxID=3365933 RepID=UPI0037F71046
MTSEGGRDAVEILETVWTWERSLPLKYVLVSEEWDEELIVWAHCAEADGLFVESASRREQLTFVGCSPTGRLLKAAERFRHGPVEPVDLGVLGLIVEFRVPGADPAGDPFHTYDSDRWGLRAPFLIGCQPSTVDPTLTDLVIEAEVEGPVWRGEPADAEWRLFNGLGGDRLGACHRVEGLYGRYGKRPFPASPPMRLIGCQPGERLLRQLVRPRGDGDRVTLLALDRTGRVMRHQEHMPLRVIASRPSELGGSLVDLWLEEGPAHRPDPVVRPVWDAWFEGPPAEPGEWIGFSHEGRTEWAAFAAAKQDATKQDAGGQLPGPVRHLDGRYVTDIPGFVCAIGEAVAGPGGHYDQCWHTLRGCPCGGDMPRSPFTLIWHDADVARRALAAVTVDAAGETPYLDGVLRLLAQVGIAVELR